MAELNHSWQSLSDPSGVIQLDEGGNDVFVHASALERAGLHSLDEGQKVSFETEVDRRSGKLAITTISLA